MTEFKQPIPERERANGAYLLRQSIQRELAQLLVGDTRVPPNVDWWIKRYQLAVAAEAETDAIAKEVEKATKEAEKAQRQ